ncbi:MAG: hypothetical protein WAX80_03070 [Minisyncoccia bacterium]
MSKLDPPNQSNRESYFDVLRQLELLTQQVNTLADRRGKFVFNRYPITFALLALFGLVTVSEATKEILKDMGVFDANPWIALVIGLFVLVLTGTIYKKLNK